MTAEPTSDLTPGYISIDSPMWRKSSWSNFNGSCVEIAQPGAGRTFVRDSKNKSGGVLLFTASQWTELLAGIKADKFNI